MLEASVFLVFLAILHYILHMDIQRTTRNNRRDIPFYLVLAGADTLNLNVYIY